MRQINMLKEFVCRPLKKEWKMAFVFTFVICLLVHLFKVTNYLPNHDSVFNTYTDQNVLASGRWLLSFACSFSSYFDLPWLIGLFSFFLISLSTVLIVDLFQIQKPLLIILTGGIIAAFPSFTEILFYEFTADGFMVAFLFSTLSVYVLFSKIPLGFRLFISAVLLCCSCGIYQAYVSFEMMIFIAVFILKIFSEKESLKTLMCLVRDEIIILIAALGGYFVIWRICMLVQHVVPTEYEGIGEVGKISISSILNAFKSSVIYFGGFFVDWDGKRPHLNMFSMLNIIFVLSFIFVIVYVVIKTKVYRSSYRLILLACSLLTIPFSACIWYFSSPGVEYKVRMVHSISAIYILAIVLWNHYFEKRLNKLHSMLIICIVFNFAVNANIAYYYMTFEYEHSFAEAVEIKGDIDKLIDNKDINSVAIIGSRSEQLALSSGMYAGNAHTLYLFEDSLLYDSVHTEYYMKSIMHMNYQFVTDKDDVKEIAETKQFKEMNSWPAKDSISVVNNIVVVKFSEYQLK